MPEKKTYRLKADPSAQGLLVGIVTDEKDYRLSWLLNHQLHINLKRTDNLKWFSTKLPVQLEFTCYIDADEVRPPTYLIRNSSANGARIPGYEKFDYLFLMAGSYDASFINQILQEVRQTKNTRGAYALDSSGLVNFIF